MTSIGFVGLGSMGQSMAQNLVRKGHGVRGFDVRPQAIAAFVGAGGQGSSSAVDCARSAEYLISDGAQCRAGGIQVLFKDDALSALPEASTVVLMSTCPPGTVEIIAARVTAAGHRLVDAPVSGGAVGAKQGKLTIMAAAPVETFNRTKPILEGMGMSDFPRR